MPLIRDASPKILVRLYKTISRKTVDGQTAVSDRYAGKDAQIDLTNYLGDGSSVITTKSVREPSGAFSITFADAPDKQAIVEGAEVTGASIETVYGLVEPMDVIDIRMWGGTGPKPNMLPIKMRGFVSEVTRSMAMGQDGKPIRTVIVSGQDYGKIWQTYQVLYLQAYAAGEALLTTFNMWEHFGIEAKNTMKSGEFVRTMIEKIINPHITGFMPENTAMPKALKLDISVTHGVVNNSYQSQQGTIYDMLKLFGDVGVWNELYTEDREDGTYVVYRPTPALSITGQGKERKIQDDAPEPMYVTIEDGDIQQYTETRTDANVANFYWVNNQRFDLIDDIYRKLFALQKSDTTVNLKDYANSSTKFYGVRAMNAETQQGEDSVVSMTTGLSAEQQEKRSVLLESWIDNRRRIMVEMNKDNVVLGRGTARIKGGLMRPPDSEGKSEHMKAGDYARFQFGNLEFEGYIVQIVDEFIPYQGYRATITFERSTGFVTRAQLEGGSSSPYLVEMATRTNDPYGKIES